MFYNDFKDTVECSNALKSYVDSNPSSEASFVMLLSLYEAGTYGTGDKDKAEYRLNDKNIVIKKSREKLFMDFA